MPITVGKTLRLVAITAVAVAAGHSSALASTGGVGTEPGNVGRASAPPVPKLSECPAETGGLVMGTCVPFKRARLFDGKAIAPPSAGEAVRQVIEAANRIRSTPYIWGGGHGNWRSPGYDCSGAVSYALHGGDLLESPMTSGELMRWGLPGKGRWITVYANPTHTFAVIDGLRWDTVGDATGTGPRWHPEMVSAAGFVARHPPGY